MLECPAARGLVKHSTAYRNGCRCTACRQAVREYYVRNRDKYRATAAAIRATPEGAAKQTRDTARRKAAAKDLPFDLRWQDLIEVPEKCPICSVYMVRGPGLSDSPSLDRLRPCLGYVLENVWYICYRCNAIKSDASPEEIRQVADVTEREIEERGL